MLVRTLIAATALASAAPALAQNDDFFGGAPEVPGFEPAFEGQFRAEPVIESVPVTADTIADGLEHPWGIVQLPDGSFLVSERPGRLRIVAADGTVSEPIEGVPEVVAQRQGGLLDVTLAPDFAETREVFMTLSHPLGGGENTTAVAKGRLSEDGTQLEGAEIIFEQQPGYTNNMHYGSRIVFEDDNTLWVGLGERSDRQTRVLAQDLSTHYGKVVRLTRDGAPADGNPFAGQADAQPEIWSWGHRNIQAAARNPATGQLWVIEHGPQGGDEVNIAEAGENYGWPVVTYGEEYGGGEVGEGIAEAPDEAFVQPAYFWSPVIAPSGATFYEGEMFPEWQGDLLVGGLRAGTLVRLDIEGERVVGEEWLVRGIGRVRDVVEAEDGSIVIITDAADGEVIRISRMED
jgi:glucose/arabinose dehydrogenase